MLFFNEAFKTQIILKLRESVVFHVHVPHNDRNDKKVDQYELLIMHKVLSA